MARRKSTYNSELLNENVTLNDSDEVKEEIKEEVKPDDTGVALSY